MPSYTNGTCVSLPLLNQKGNKTLLELGPQEYPSHILKVVLKYISALSNALISMHAFTGCDFVSDFSGHRKALIIKRSMIICLMLYTIPWLSS